MKKNYFSTIMLASFLFTTTLWSCKGPDGDTGPIGATGAAGTAGAAGTKGDTGPIGNANVQYTTWKTPAWVNYSKTSDNQYAFLNVTDTKQPLFTKGVLDSSAIYIYLKTQNIQWDQTTSEYKLAERITNDPNIYGYFKIPGRTTNAFEDFFQINVGINLIGENFLDPYMQFYTNQYDYTTQKNVAIPELLSKNAAYFKDLVKDLPQYRIVIIPASIKAGRAKSIDFKNYNSVKQALNLPD